ncbi:MAG: SdrD B-like domain-containing protein, partial [Saprospiraceae bacterium]
MRKLIRTHTTGFFHLTRSAMGFRRMALLLVPALISFCQTRSYTQCQTKPNEIQGIVFLDQNYNGQLDAQDLLQSQVKILAFGKDGQLVAQAISDVNGTYRLSGLVNNIVYRLEMQKPADFYFAKSSSQGAHDIRFTTAPACDVNFGLQNKEALCAPEIANVFTSCFVKADGSDAAPTLIQMPFQFKSSTMPSKIAMQNQTGSVWGLAFNRSRQALYSSAFIKYGAALGVGGSGGIYITDPAKPSTELFLNLNTYGIQTGPGQFLNPLDCGYSKLVGKSGLGDMDISDDDQYLFVTNLYNKSLVIIPTDHPTASSILEIKIPDPGCNQGDYVVGAVEYYNGQVYLGVTCTAETSKNKNDFAFHIYQFNLLSKSFNLIFSSSFAREYWLSNPTVERPVSQWLTNIAFADDNFMILGIADRTGHTYCDPVYPLTGTYGDILMLYKSGTSWFLENKGVAGSRTGSGPYNFEGPGGGEFFGDYFWSIGPGLHPETSFGSVCVLKGT